KIGNGRHTIIVGLVYTLGRMVSYASLASLILYVGVNSQEISFFLQNYGEKLLGPLLLIMGLVMLEVVRFNWGDGNNFLNNAKEQLSERGIAGSFLLGMLFALSFCPFSGVLYFGMLIPLALKTNDGFLIPSVFAFATGLPVILSSILLVKSVSTLGNVVNKSREIEKTIRKLVALVFIIVGIYYISLAVT
ncbi:MAG: aromatic aminobenezylarsenical efflux permease ArsG family transporter, partial [Candidatus Altiarchaeota archaeon]